MVPGEAYGVKLMSIAFLVKPKQPLIWRGPMLHSAIRQFITDVDWGDLDYLVVDLPPGTGDAPLSLVQSMPLSGAVIVTLPQKVSLEDAGRYLELEDGSRVDIFGTGGGQQLAEETDTPFLGTVPLDPAVRQSGDSGVPVVVSHPDSAAAQALIAAAEQIAANVSRFALEAGGDIQLDIMD
jgi:ATP-binding protein involved in chromosome partitioning